MLHDRNPIIGRKMRVFSKLFHLVTAGLFAPFLSERELLLAANALSRNTQNAEANALRWKLLALIDRLETD